MGQRQSLPISYRTRAPLPSTPPWPLPPLQPVEWSEINSALGQAVMLLALVASRVGHVFARYRLVPIGSFSRLAPLGDERAMHDLHYDGSYFGQRKFTASLKAFLQCIAELGDFATAQDRSFRLPYAIAPGGERVHDLSVAVSARYEDAVGPANRPNPSATPVPC